MARVPLLALALMGAALAGCITVDVPAPSGEPRAGAEAPADAASDGRAASSAAGAGSATSTASSRPTPRPKDSDRDGVSDVAERENGTDPRDAADSPYVLPAVPAVDAGLLLDDLAEFATRHNERRANTPDHLASRDWLAGRFAGYGLEVWRQPFSADGLDQENIVGIRWGLDRTSWVAVGAHYDTTTTAGVDASASQGAYDDGSGTMMVVHLARAFANLTLPYTVAFVAFDGEERGLEGSQAFLQATLAEETPYPDARLVGAVDIDMFGLNWPGTGTPMVFITNSQEAQDAVEEARRGNGVPDEGISYTQGIVLGSSDFATFFAQGVPTGFFISDFDQVGAPFGLPAGTPIGVYPFWHFSDTMETMTMMAGDAEHLRMGFQAGVDLAADLVHFLASTPELEAGTDAV